MKRLKPIAMHVAGLGLLALGALALHPHLLLADTEAEWRIPPRWARMDNPVPLDARSVHAAAGLWQRECVSCHGTTGRGDGPEAARRRWSAGDLTDPAHWQESDGVMYWKVTQGRRPMPGYRRELTDEQRWHLVNYMRTLAPRPPDHDMAGTVRSGISAVLEASFELAAVLAAPETDGLATAVGNVGDAIAQLRGLELDDLDEELEQTWNQRREALERAAAALDVTAEPQSVRRAFAAYSDALVDVVAAFGHDLMASEDRPLPVIEYGCVEALEDEPASWLQPAGADLTNPYVEQEGDCERVHRLRIMLGAPIDRRAGRRIDGAGNGNG